LLQTQQNGSRSSIADCVAGGRSRAGWLVSGGDSALV
jgi:hypothetical protein